MRIPLPIASASHPLARQARALGRGVRERREEGLFLVEGPRGIGEALDSGAALVWVLAGVSRLDAAPVQALVERCLDASVPVQPIRDPILDRLAPAEHGPGLLGACRLPDGADDPEVALARALDGLVLVTWEIQDPGNLGTLMRSALAFGATAMVAAGGADPWTPKAVRASAGAIHRLPIARGEAGETCFARIAQHRGRLIAAIAEGGAPPEAINWRGPCALVVGSEVRGVPDFIAASATGVTIPIAPHVESLSVAIAGSILLAIAARAAR